MMCLHLLPHANTIGRRDSADFVLSMRLCTEALHERLKLASFRSLVGCTTCLLQCGTIVQGRPAFAKRRLCAPCKVIIVYNPLETQEGLPLRVQRLVIRAPNLNADLRSSEPRSGVPDHNHLTRICAQILGPRKQATHGSDQIIFNRQRSVARGSMHPSKRLPVCRGGGPAHHGPAHRPIPCKPVASQGSLRQSTPGARHSSNTKP